MAKLTKQQRKAHAEAEAILTKDRIPDDERDFVFQNWHEGATHENGAAGAFFTPFGLACDFALDGSGRRVIDLCAGIGVLSYIIHHRGKWGERLAEITCVEINPRYVAVGRKLLPQARWINADIFDWRTLDLGRYDVAIANPPFGRVKRSNDAPRYRGPEFEFHVIDIAREFADRGAFIVSQESASFRYSGRQCFDRRTSGRGVEFERATGVFMDIGAGVDTNFHRDEWKDGAPLCEIVCIDFEAARERGAALRRRLDAYGAPAMQPGEQMALPLLRERRAEALARGNPAPRSPRPLPTPRRRPSIPDAPNIRLRRAEFLPGAGGFSFRYVPCRMLNHADQSEVSRENFGRPRRGRWLPLSLPGCKPWQGSGRFAPVARRPRWRPRSDL
jgi:SAM-dependent methyltransferase